MSIRGVTFNKQMCKSEDDALIFDTFLNKCVGRVIGCAVSYDETSVYIAPGYFMTKGRLVNVVGTETRTPEAIPTGRQYNRLVFTVDLSKENTAQIFNQGFFEFLSSYDAMPGLTQEDLFNGGAVFQIPFCQFVLTVDGITDFKDELGTVNVSEIWATLNADLNQYRKQFDAYFTDYRRQFVEFFNAEEQVILQMIQDLSDKNFVTNKVFDDQIAAIKSEIFSGEITSVLCGSDGEPLQTSDYEDLVVTKNISFK